MNIDCISVILGIVPHKENIYCINHCIVYTKYFIHKDRKKMVKPDTCITKFVKYSKYAFVPT